MSVLDEDTKRIGRYLHYSGLLATVLCGVVAYSLTYAPTVRRIEATRARINELKLLAKNAPVIRREHDKAKRYLQIVTHRLEVLRQRVPSDAEAGEFLRQVTQIASEQQLDISNFQPERTLNKEGYAEMEVTLSGKGDFNSVCTFFDRLEKLPRLSKVRHLNLSNGAEPRQYPMKATLLIYFGLKDSRVVAGKGIRRG